MPDSPPSLTPEQVADLLAVYAQTSKLIAAEADRLTSTRSALSADGLDRLRRLADALRPGAEARLRLSRIDPDLLLAGTSVWIQRRLHPGEVRSAPRTSAAALASARWGGASG